MNKPKVLICGNYGVENIGDELILRALLERWGESADITVLCPFSKQVTQKYNIPAIRLWPTGIRSWLRSILTGKGRADRSATQKAIKECDQFILGSGTLLTDEPWKSLWIWGRQMEWAYHFKKTVNVHASGIGPFRGYLSQKWARRLLSRTETITVRDKRSQEWVKKLLGRSCTVVRDPVMEWNMPEVKKPKNFPAKYTIIVPRYWKRQNEQITRLFRDFIKKFMDGNKDQMVILIPFERTSVQEQKMIRNIAAGNESSRQVMVWNDYDSELEVLGAIQHAESLIGMRLHSLILAEKCKIPFVGIATMEKLQGFGEEVHKKKQIIALEKLTLQHLQEIHQATLNSDT